MIISSSNIKNWSRIGSRATFGLAVIELAKELSNLMVLTADVSTSAGLDRFRRTYPDNYLDVGIAEQNMMGIATGLSSEGYNVFTTTFAPFQTMRCCEQIRVNLGYMKHKVTMVGLASGIVLGTLGNTHCCMEDIGVLRSIPNITIVSPCDGLEIVKSVFAAASYPGPLYIRLTGGINMPIINQEDYHFEIGKSITLRQGTDITIISNGMMVKQSLMAAEILESKGISASVVNMHTIKPLDLEAIDNAAKTKLIVTIEEHNVIGGLGSAIAEYKSTLKNAPPHVILGLKDEFGTPGEYQYLLDKYGLTGEKIAKAILLKWQEYYE